jgi:hypothetical protein
LNYYYTAEKNWKKVYNDKDEFSDLCNKWEQWEPQDKSRKNPIRTNWRKNEVEQNATREEDAVDEWWEAEHMGYTRRLIMSPSFIGMMKSDAGSVVMIRMNEANGG